MGNLAQILLRMAALKQKSDSAKKQMESEKRDAIRAKLIKCAGGGTVTGVSDPYRHGCGKASPLRKWILRLNYFWDSDTGSPNGGFWDYGRQDYDDLQCPKCGKWNYIYCHPDKKIILELRSLADGIDVFRNVVRHNHEM